MIHKFILGRCVQCNLPQGELKLVGWECHGHAKSVSKMEPASKLGAQSGVPDAVGSHSTATKMALSSSPRDEVAGLPTKKEAGTPTEQDSRAPCEEESGSVSKWVAHTLIFIFVAIVILATGLVWYFQSQSKIVHAGTRINNARLEDEQLNAQRKYEKDKNCAEFEQWARVWLKNNPGKEPLLLYDSLRRDGYSYNHNADRTIELWKHGKPLNLDRVQEAREQEQKVPVQAASEQATGEREDSERTARNKVALDQASREEKAKAQSPVVLKALPVESPPTKQQASMPAPPEKLAADLVTAFLKHGEDPDIQTELADYAETVKPYFDQAQLKRAAILKDLTDFRAKWPKRSLQLVGIESVRQNGAKTLEATYRLRYSTSDGGHTRSGTLVQEIHFTLTGKNWLVSGVKTVKPASNGENVRPVASSPLEKKSTGLSTVSDEEFEKLMQSANQGDVHAQATLGNCYFFGHGVKNDNVEAVKWYRKAADQGDANAQTAMGSCYEFGNGVTKDNAEAVKWYRKAADQGLDVAQHNLAVCYERGNGVKKDDVEAVKWYRKAADQGLGVAQCNIGACYENGNGVTKDDAEAAKWYRKAAEQGYAEAQYAIALCYECGIGVEKDDTEAVKWCQKAAVQGLATAQGNLGVCYAKGRGVEKNDEEAVKWYRKAAEQGLAHAQYDLAACYGRGNGVKKDSDEAMKWCRKAAEQGYAAAQCTVGLSYELGNGVKKDLSEAVKWYRKAADQGNVQAQGNLGLCYANGEGVKRNYTEAAKWFRKAADQGLATAQGNLGVCYD